MIHSAQRQNFIGVKTQTLQTILVAVADKAGAGQAVEMQDGSMIDKAEVDNAAADRAGKVYKRNVLIDSDVQSGGNERASGLPGARALCLFVV